MCVWPAKTKRVVKTLNASYIIQDPLISRSYYQPNVTIALLKHGYQ